MTIGGWGRKDRRFGRVFGAPGAGPGFGNSWGYSPRGPLSVVARWAGRAFWVGTWLVSVTLHLAAIAAVSWGAETVIVNQSFHGREINLRAGATLQVELEQPGATGHLWELRDLDPEHLELLGVETREPSDPDRTGAPLGKTWRLRALRPGTANLTFLLLRPWEGPGEAVDTFALRVRIL